MALKMKLSQKLVQKMALTPQMKQSIHILQLPLLELKDYLQQQIEENPALEDAGDSDLKEDSISDEKINTLLEQSKEYSRDSESIFNAGYSREEIQKKQDYRESLITKEPSLQEYLIKQLRMQSLSEKDYKIGELLISYIDENGYFQGSTDEITQVLISKGIESQAQDIENILSLIQTFEPIGIGSRNLKECLIIQLTAKGKQDSLSCKIIQNHLPDLAKNKTKLIARSLKVDVSQVNEALQEISRLEPKPGRSFTQGESRRILPAIPDVIVEKIDNRYEVIVNARELPKLKINSRYKNLLSRKDVPETTKKYLKGKIGSALWLIKVVAQRQETIRRIAECIIKIQKEYFQQGQEDYLKPLTLQEVAGIVGRNESTISRVVNKKYIQTPYGIVKLSYFFSKSFQTTQGEAVSAEAIKSQIIALINEEEPRYPISDDKIAKHFATQGINIARRTIAKYREKLKIPPSHLRKAKSR